MNLEIIGLNKAYGEMTVFSDFHLSIPLGQITCILGPSGCGKTTLLNIIGGITKPDSGSLLGFEGKKMSCIFQDPRLLPWKTAEENIAFVLTRQSGEAARKKITSRFIRLVDLEGFADYYPSKLSGGMRQRVSIARAFAYPSDIILMDEPLKGLDITLKLNLIKAFSRIWSSDRRTVIFVTHDVEEALLLGNKIFVLSRSPVRIVAHEIVRTPMSERSPDTTNLKELKKVLQKALGKE